VKADGHGEGRPILELRNIDTHYGPMHILRDVSVEIYPGEIVCLLGGNASGKTTTLKTILGYVRPTRGEVVLDENDIVTRRQPALNTSTGAVVLGLLPDRESVQRPAADGALVGYGVGHRVRSEGEAADVGGLQFALFDQVQAHPADEELTPSGHGRAAGVDVVRRTGAAREGKISELQRALHEERKELSSVIHGEDTPRGRPRRQVEVRKPSRAPGGLHKGWMVS
jgi:energy-coupling factor transporter ATP-binding protein EcfA2